MNNNLYGIVFKRTIIKGETCYIVLLIPEIVKAFDTPVNVAVEQKVMTKDEIIAGVKAGKIRNVKYSAVGNRIMGVPRPLSSMEIVDKDTNYIRNGGNLGYTISNKTKPKMPDIMTTINNAGKSGKVNIDIADGSGVKQVQKSSIFGKLFGRDNGSTNIQVGGSVSISTTPKLKKLKIKTCKKLDKHAVKPKSDAIITLVIDCNNKETLNGCLNKVKQSNLFKKEELKTDKTDLGIRAESYKVKQALELLNMDLSDIDCDITCESSDMLKDLSRILSNVANTSVSLNKITCSIKVSILSSSTVKIDTQNININLDQDIDKTQNVVAQVSNFTKYRVAEELTALGFIVNLM